MKSIFASKTFWANIIGMAAMAAPYIHPAGAVLASPEVQATLVGAALGVANVVLRVITHEPVKVL